MDYQSFVASAETWSPTLAPGEKPDLQNILNEAKNLMDEGKYEEALQRQIWYFNHALEFDPAQTGVRLSFALAQWVELGRRYPRAKQALLEIRDRDTQRLAAGKGFANLFSDVNSINNYLGQEDATLALFKTIYQTDNQLAKGCYFYAENLLIQHGEYELLLNCLGDPQARFDSYQRGFEATDRITAAHGGNPEAICRAAQDLPVRPRRPTSAGWPPTILWSRFANWLKFSSPRITRLMRKKSAARP